LQSACAFREIRKRDRQPLTTHAGRLGRQQKQTGPPQWAAFFLSTGHFPDENPFKPDVDPGCKGGTGPLSPLAGLRLAMTALVQNLSRFSNTANIEAAKDVAMVGGAILLVAMLFASV
jgi:hypothetical protein